MSQIDGATILITGAGGGIGRQLALRLSDLGARVVLWDVDAERLTGVASEVEERSANRPSIAEVDVGDGESVRRAAQETKDAVGPVDILVNNAGVVSGRALLELSDRQIAATFAVNTLALFWTTRAFLPDMIRRGRGHIVTIASAAGLIGVSRLSDYAASKHAAVGFDESLRAELRRIAPAIATTVVCPSYIDTGMFAGARTRFPRLLPILEGRDVVERIVRAIRRDEPRVVMPPFLRALPLLRALPIRVFDRIADVLGVNDSMDEFTGRRT